MSSCSVCNKKAEPAYSVTHRCSHSTHVDCIEGDIDPFKCPQCLISKESEGGGAKRIDFKIVEPHLTDKNYIKYPGTESKGWVSSVGGAVVSLGSKLLVGKTKSSQPTKKSALDLVKEGVPIADIFKEGYGLDHMLRDGVTIDHLLLSRYKWEDICMFDDVSRNGQKRALDALAAGPGLRMTANHLRDYPDQLPFEEFKRVTGLESSQLCTVLGMEFPPDSSLECVGDSNWNAKDCVRLGLKMSDLIDFGLYCVEQYVDLMKGLSKAEQAQVEKQLEVTEKQLEGLRNLEEEAKEAEQQRFIQQQQEEPTAKEVDPQDQEEDEEEEEEEEQEETKPVKNKVDSPPFRPRFRVKTPVVTNHTQKKNRLAHLGYVK
jgi:hypothetical protein